MDNINADADTNAKAGIDVDTDAKSDIDIDAVAVAATVTGAAATAAVATAAATTTTAVATAAAAAAAATTATAVATAATATSVANANSTVTAVTAATATDVVQNYFVRAKFVRGNSVKYISHLDMIRMFSRAFRRAGLQISWSQGFNPHPVMVFALPLAVGVISEGEYMDIGFEVDIDPQKFVLITNKHLPNGFKFLEAKKSSGKGLMGSVMAAEYEIRIKESSESANGKDRLYQRVCNVVRKIDELNELIVNKVMEKKGVKKTIGVDIKPMIRSLSVTTLDLSEEYAQTDQFDNSAQSDNSDYAIVRATVDAGSRSNLRPDLLYSALESLASVTAGDVVIKRKNLYGLKNGMLTNLWE